MTATSSSLTIDAGLDPGLDVVVDDDDVDDYGVPLASRRWAGAAVLSILFGFADDVLNCLMAEARSGVRLHSCPCACQFMRKNFVPS